MQSLSKAFLKRFVEEEKNNIREYFHANKLAQPKGLIRIKFKPSPLRLSNGLARIDFKFQNLWELDEVPQFILIEFKFDFTSSYQLDKYLSKQDSLINKILGRLWPQNLINPTPYHIESSRGEYYPSNVKMKLSNNQLKVTIISQYNPNNILRS